MGGTIDPADDGDLERYFLGQLQIHDDLAGLYLGRPDGSFVFVSRDDTAEQGGFRTKVITTAPTRSVDLVYLDAAGVERSAEQDPADTYDPRGRPWYAAASDAGGVAWTEPYVFFTSQTPGITVALPVTRSDGAPAGVVGVDIDLSDVSAFLDGLQISPNGVAFILDADGTVVAFSDQRAVVRAAEDGELSTVHASEIDDEQVRSAYDRLDGSADETMAVSFSLSGSDHTTVFSPLPSRPGWVVGVTAPEQDFLGTVSDRSQTNTLLAVVIGVGALVLAVPFLGRFTRGVTRMERRAATDPLTRVMNRRGFDEALALAVGQADVEERPLSALVVDLDHFKEVNDRLGHAAGDEALTEVARVLRRTVRETDVVARAGGDEFVALLTEQPLHVAQDVAERVRLEVAGRQVSTSQGPIGITVTIGVAPWRGGAGEALLEEADQALLAAKSAGRNRVGVGGAAATHS